LKIPDSVLLGTENENESLKDAIEFWQEWLSGKSESTSAINEYAIWNEQTLNIIYDELLYMIIKDITDLNL
jgi:hypothetical protein